MLLLAFMAGQATAFMAEDMEGRYEAVDGSANTCAHNPARLTIRRTPDHLSFDWPVPMTIFDGSTSRGVTYDLLEERADALVLRLEGETRRTDGGQPVIWLLRPNPDLSGFCWGRTDWPTLHCESAYRRCEQAAPTS